MESNKSSTLLHERLKIIISKWTAFVLWTIYINNNFFYSKNSGNQIRDLSDPMLNYETQPKRHV